jgi:hypothetical protein
VYQIIFIWQKSLEKITGQIKVLHHKFFFTHLTDLQDFVYIEFLTYSAVFFERAPPPPRPSSNMIPAPNIDS